MNSIFANASFSKLWENYHNMPTKTTMLDQIITIEKNEQKSFIHKAINEATDRQHIQSKKVDGGFFRRFDQAKAQQAQNTRENINELRRFLGKGNRIDAYI